MHMLRFVVFVVVAGCSCSPVPDVGDVGLDVGFNDPDASTSDASDAGADAADVGTPDVPPRPDVGPNLARGHRPSMQVFDRKPCEPWETVAPPLPRGLPSDPTPRVLWTYQPGLDPNDEPAAHYRSRVRTPVVSPDGTIWVHGPDFDQISQLNRDGTLRGWFEVGGRDFEKTRSDWVIFPWPRTVMPWQLSMCRTPNSGGSSRESTQTFPRHRTREEGSNSM